MTTTPAHATAPDNESRITLDALRRWNAGLGALHLAQAVVATSFASSRSLPGIPAWPSTFIN